MKDSRTLLLLFVSLLLLLASITLLWSWGYQFRYSHKGNGAAITSPYDSARTSRQISDSLQKAYYATLDHLDKTIDSVYTNTDSLQGNLGVKLSEFYQLRTQITDLYKNRGGDEDIKLASNKINELQQRLRQLQISNVDVENENKRLHGLLQQYSNQRAETATPITTFPDASSLPKAIPVKNNFTAANLTASDLQLVAISEASGKEMETLQTEEGLKLSGSFIVKNSTTQSNNSELVIIVLQPDGKVLQKSTWESGSFETNAGKKIYSCKLQAECKSGESKRLHFLLSSDTYEKGNYSMQVYHNGIMIARITKQLS